VPIRCHDRREREQPRHQLVDRVILEELRAAACDHDRIHDEWHAGVGEVVGNGPDQLRREEHPRLRRIDPDVVEDRLELSADELGRELVHRRNLDRVLRGQRDDRRHPVAAGSRERLQVRLDPRASAGVRPGNGQCSRNHLSPSAGMTRIRFDGCDLSRPRGTPVARV
jgi:hypothetical protein